MHSERSASLASKNYVARKDATTACAADRVGEHHFRKQVRFVPKRRNIQSSDALINSAIAPRSATPEDRLALFEECPHSLCIVLAVVHHAAQALHPFEALG